MLMFNLFAKLLLVLGFILLHSCSNEEWGEASTYEHSIKIAKADPQADQFSMGQLHQQMYQQMHQQMEEMQKSFSTNLKQFFSDQSAEDFFDDHSAFSIGSMGCSLPSVKTSWKEEQIKDAKGALVQGKSLYLAPQDEQTKVEFKTQEQSGQVMLSLSAHRKSQQGESQESCTMNVPSKLDPKRIQIAKVAAAAKDQVAQTRIFFPYASQSKAADKTAPQQGGRQEEEATYPIEVEPGGQGII